MSERKEIIQAIQEKKALEDALKAIKKEDRKKALKKIFALIKQGIITVWGWLVHLKNGIAYVFNVTNSFREARNLQAQIKIRDAQTEEETKKILKTYKSKRAVVALLAFLIGANIPDADISIKEVTSSVKGNAIKVFAKEIDTEKTDKTINSENVESTQNAKARSIDAPEVNKITDSNEEVQAYLIGKVSSKFELGTEDIGAVVENKNGTCIYGQFSSDSSKEDYVINFLKYMTSVDKDMYTNNFSGSDAPGTESFKTHWENTVKKEGNNFNNMQVEYKWNNLVKPTVEKIKKELNVDFSETLLLQELIYSTVSQYESEKAFELIKNSNLHINMTEIEILNAVQDEKEASLGKYTYTNEDGCDDKFRDIIKTRINSERIELSRLTGKPAQAM